MCMKIKNIQDIVLPADKHVVFITGVTGQDGSHMVDYLLRETNVSVVGGVRLLSTESQTNISHFNQETSRLQLCNFDLTDSHSIYKVMETIKPEYFINFAAQSFVHGSWDIARATWQANSTAVLDCLESIRQMKPTCRFYNAGSSEEFGNVLYDPQDENHPPHPRSPYGASKCAARTLIKVYRESYGIYAVQGWLFNHEGTRRGEKFVTRKISKGVARIVKSLKENKPFGPIELGNIDAKRDWSDAEDMVDGVWRMLNQDKFNTQLNTDLFEEFPEIYNEYKNKKQMTEWLSKRIKDYVCSSDENHSIREFIEESFNTLNIKGMWYITDNDLTSEKYVYVDSNGVTHMDKILVKINPSFYRPAEVEILRGDSSKIRKELGWHPNTDFKALVKKMVINDFNLNP